jgi:hypothetical protein
MILQLRADFEKLIALVTGPEAHTASLDQMERSLFRHVLRLGLGLLQLFLCTRVQAESHSPQPGNGRTRLPYHSQKSVDYFSIFGKLTFERAYFYAPGQPGVYPLDQALSLPERCYSDLLRENVELLGVESAFGKGLQVVTRLLGLTVPKLALETVVAEHSQHSHIRDQVALTDGSEPLQKRMLAKLSGFTLVLDIIHVGEHLWKAGAAIYGETDPQRAEWVEAQMLDILTSRADTVIERLENKARAVRQSSQASKVFQQVANYLRRNQPYMDYADYLRRGWPIGTGVIEGVCRHLVKDRMELSGMRWTITGAGSLLALRAVNENGDWEEFHEFRRTQRHKQLYGTPLDKSWLDQAERLEINQF